MSFKRYVAISDRTVAEIAKSIGVTRQNCDNWIRRGTPIFVGIDPDKFECIKTVHRKHDIYLNQEN